MTSFRSDKPMPWEPTKAKPTKPKPEAIRSEHGEQVRFVTWMRETYPEHLVFAIPNGGSRHPAEAQSLCNEGVSPGVPDLMIPSLKLFIEMKRSDGGTISPEQNKWILYLRSCGYMAGVANGCEAAKLLVVGALGK